MAEQLYLNNILIDIKDKSITRKIHIGDIGDISKRKSTYSYTFNVTRTSKTTKIFDMLGVAGNTSRKPFELITATYIVDGITLIANGFAKISAMSGYFDVNIYDGIKTISEKIGNKTLSDLPSDSYNDILLDATFARNIYNEDNFVYGIARFSNPSTIFPEGRLDIDEQSASYYVHSLLRDIFNSNDLALYGELFFENEEFYKEVITAKKGNQAVFDWYLNDNTEEGSAHVTPIVKTESKNIPFKDTEKFTIVNDDLNSAYATVVAGEINIVTAGWYELVFDTYYTIDQTSANLEIKVNDIQRAFIYLKEENAGKNQHIFINLNVSDKVSVSILANSKITDAIIDSGVYKIDYDIDIASIDLITAEYHAGVIEGKDYFQDIKQVDFIKEIVNRYGLLIQNIKHTEEFRFKPIESVLTNRTRFIDWSDKLSLIKKENYISGYAKNNILQYKYPEIGIDETFDNIDGNVFTDNDNTKEEKVILNSSYQVPTKKTVIILIKWEFNYGVSPWVLHSSGGDVTMSYTWNIRKLELTQTLPTSYDYNPYIEVPDAHIIAGKSYRISFDYDGAKNVLLQKIRYSTGVINISEILDGSGNYSVEFEAEYTNTILQIFFDGKNYLTNINLDNITISETNTLDDYYNIPLMENGIGAGSFNPSKETPIKLMSIERVNTSFYTVFLDRVTASEDIENNIPFLSLDNVDFQDYADIYYDAFERLIKDYREVDMLLNLSVIDIYNLDFFRLVYLKQTGRYYYLDSVTNTQGKLSKVRMIEIVNFD